MRPADICQRAALVAAVSIALVACASESVSATEGCREPIHYVSDWVIQGSGSEKKIDLKSRGLDGNVRFLLKVQSVEKQQWDIELSTEKMGSFIITHQSKPGVDGYYLTPVLGTDPVIKFSRDAPRVEVAYFVMPCILAGPLSVFGDDGKLKPNGDPQYISISDIAAKRAAYVDADAVTLEAAARSVVWLGIFMPEPAPPHRYYSVTGCTGLLVSERIVATNQHCFYDRKKPENRYAIRVWSRTDTACPTAQGDFTGCREARPTVEDLEVLDPWLEVDGVHLDIVFLRLPGAIPGSSARTLSRTTPRDEAPLAILGYPSTSGGLKPLGISATKFCQVLDINQSNGSMLHACNSDGGASGSPIFARDLKGPAVAIHNYGAQNDNELNGAVLAGAIVEALERRANGTGAPPGAGVDPAAAQQAAKDILAQFNQQLRLEGK